MAVNCMASAAEESAMMNPADKPFGRHNAMQCDTGNGANQAIWHASDTLPERVKRLRREFFSFDTRAFRNEVLPFTTGAPWDVVYSCHRWTNVPEVAVFLRAYEDSLAAAARPVPLPPGFWKMPLIQRTAVVFAEVLRAHLPVAILDGE
jgi:hypothetical protein